MNLDNKISYYARFSTYADMLGKDVIAYVYAKDENLVDFQLRHLKTFSKTKDLNVKNIYIDTFGSNKLENKINLKKLIDENSNINVLVTGIDRLSRNTMDIFEIENLCKKKNIGFFDISSDKFIFDDLFHSFEKVIEEIVYINPTIKRMLGHTRFLEGCGSCKYTDGNYVVGEVDRPYKIEVEYFDIKGNKHSKIIEGFEATIFCHEYDHLNGILHMDRIDDSFLMTLEQMKSYRANNSYKIFSTEDDFIYADIKKIGLKK